MTTGPRSEDRTPPGPTAWWVGAVGTSLWGVTAALQHLPWQSVVAVGLAAGLLVASLTLSSEAVSSDHVDLARAGRIGLLSALVVVVGVGLASSVGAPGVALLALLVLTRPGLRGRISAALSRRRAGTTQDREKWWEGLVTPEPQEDRDDAWDRTVPGTLATEPEPRTAQPSPDRPLDTAPDWSPTLTVPTHLSDQDLCLAWESSSRALHQCASIEERLELVRVRQACLDELERRQPEAVRAWVLAGADTESGPGRYLAG